MVENIKRLEVDCQDLELEIESVPPPPEEVENQWSGINSRNNCPDSEVENHSPV